MHYSELRKIALATLFSVAVPGLAGAGSGTETSSIAMREGVFVVINHECQYSAWPGKWELPAGWQSTGLSCKFEACLRHIDRLWTDMRPLSIRDHVDEMMSRAGQNR